MSKNCFQSGKNLKLSLAAQKFCIIWLSAYLLPPPPFSSSLGSFVCSYFFMSSLLLHSEWSYHFFSVDTGGWVFKMLIVSLFATLIFLVFYFQTVNLACTGIQFVHPVGTVLSDELFVSCDDSVTRMGKFVFWLAYSHYLGLGNNIT